MQLGRSARREPLAQRDVVRSHHARPDHGGPQVRDTWGYNAEAQWLANRGYLCVQVNYRGSTGYGKAFVAAGDREWGGKMHDDLVDAVDYIVAQGWADRAKVAIYGGSYGGYAASDQKVE